MPEDAKNAVLEVPPTGESDKCAQCAEEVFSRGLCRQHYLDSYRGNTPRKPREKKEKPPEVKSALAASIITRDEVKSMVIVSMQFLAGTVDESFNVLQADHTPEKRVEEAVDQMMPWVAIYGASLVKVLPWFGLAGGILMLTAPAFDPCCEIVAGVRKPRLLRKGAEDIYTDAGKRMLARKLEEKQQQGLKVVSDPPPSDPQTGKAGME